jgi:hypothetical protein
MITDDINGLRMASLPVQQPSTSRYQRYQPNVYNVETPLHPLHR